jgi:hypothetical protein
LKAKETSVAGTFLLLIAMAGAEPAPAAADCVARLLPLVPAPAAQALDRIPDPGRRLLAMQAYLRAHDITARWSWDEARIRAYHGSPAQLLAEAAIGKVQAAFAAANPGFRLHVNTQVRSLDLQLAHWNENASVGTAAAALAAEAEAACAAAPSRFGDWLRGWRPAVRANLAAPGLSPHGQARAFDFQVIAQQGNALIAGTDSRRIEQDWRDGGWAERLRNAIVASGQPFVGPLASPDEPWHYAWQGVP